MQNGSQVKKISSKEDVGRSEILSLLILDEVFFIDKIDEIWTTNRRYLLVVVVLIYPHRMVLVIGFIKHGLVKRGTNQFNWIKLHWTVHPDRTEDWRTEQDKLLKHWHQWSRM